MNVKPGGIQRRMHATTIPMDNPHPELRGQTQEMSFPMDLPVDHKYYKFRGEPKGMQAVLEDPEEDSACMRPDRTIRRGCTLPWFVEAPALTATRF